MSFPFLPKLRPSGCGDPGAEINYSCLFDGAQFLTWTPAAAQADRKLWTFSAWVRRAKVGVAQAIFSSGAESHGYDLHDLRFGADDKVWFGLAYEVPNAAFCATVAQFRDPAAWLHIVAVFDTANPIAADRMRLYVNGERQAVTSVGTAAFPVAQNTQGFVGGANPLRIGMLQYIGSYYLSGQLAEVNFVWGQGLDPAAFGYRNRTGVWVPRRYLGTYGAIGRHLAFADPLAPGVDTSGNGLPFSTSGLVATSQATDTPPHGFATLNALQPIAAQVLSAGNLKNTISNSSGVVRQSTIPMISGRWYAEVTCSGTLGGGSGNNFNIMHVGVQRTDKIGSSLFTSGVAYYSDATKLVDGVSAAFGALWKSPGTVYVVGVLLDLSAGTVQFFLNGVSQGVVALPVLGAAWAFAGVWGSSTGSGVQEWNFGQRAFLYPANQGAAKPLATPNLSCPAIQRPERYATTRLRSAAAAVADLPWSPLDRRTIVISKRLDGTTDWRVNDSAKPGRAWAPNLATGDFAEADGLTFTASGYTLGAAAAYQGAREDWIFRVASAAGFDVVDVVHVTGAPTTVPHAAGGIIDYAWVVPLTGGDRRVYLRGLAAGQYVVLNTAVPYATQAGWFTATAVDLTIGAAMPSGTYRVLAWRSVPGFSWFGTFIGNGSVDGAFIPLDFAPAMMHSRPIHTTTGLWLFDTARNPTNPVNRLIGPGEASIDHVTTDYVDLVSNGVKWRTGSNDRNASGQTHILAAWAGTPLKLGRAR